MDEGINQEEDCVIERMSIEETARAYARTAAEAFRDEGKYFQSLPRDAWHDRTGAEEWDMTALAGHVVGEAVWFPNVVRGVTRGEQPYPDSLWEELKRLPVDQIGERQVKASEELVTAVDEATPEQLREQVSMGWTKLPLWNGLYVSLMEAVYHNWDAHAVRDAPATIPTPWAQLLATNSAQIVPGVAHRKWVEAYPGTYLFRVGDGVGPVTVIARDGKLTAEEGETAAPDLTLHLAADQYVRLIAGRLRLERDLEARAVQAEGDRTKVAGLAQIFKGIANAD